MDRKLWGRDFAWYDGRKSKHGKHLLSYTKITCLRLGMIITSRLKSNTGEGEDTIAEKIGEGL